MKDEVSISYVRKEIEIEEVKKAEVETKIIYWAIPNFPVIVQSISLLNAQSLEFTAGETLDRETKWKLSLRSTSSGSTVHLYWDKDEPEPSTISAPNTTCVRLQLMILGKEKRLDWSADSGVKTVSNSNRHFPINWFLMYTNETEKFFGENELTIKVTFETYLYPTSTEQIKPSQGTSDLDRMKCFLTAQALKDVAGVREGRPCMDIKLVSMDKKEFPAQKQILAVRSPLLTAMLRSGVIHLHDISSRGLEVLIRFINTGELHPNWTEAGVTVELTDAAGKYQLQDLLKFLDVALGKVCKPENAIALYALAQELSLKIAEEDLRCFIKLNDIQSPKSVANEVEEVTSKSEQEGTVNCTVTEKSAQEGAVSSATTKKSSVVSTFLGWKKGK